MLINTTLRIAQIIDSLDPGGAERMAVNLCNAYAEEGIFSGMIVTRNEGSLKSALSPNVSYLYLNRTKKIDIKALFKARAYLKKNNITHVQAHGTSLFFAVLLKITSPALRIIWHDHLGNRAEKNKENLSVRILSFFVYRVLVVNETLEKWAFNNLWCKTIKRISNFTSITQEVEATFLKGINEKRIVCLANLKHPKNHFFILNCFYESSIHELGWTLHFVGKDFDDSYSKQLKNYIQEKKITSKVFFYGSCADTHHILRQAQVGVLGSTYEGFPVVLLEYGLAKLTVIATDVGYNSHLINADKTGWLIRSNNKNDGIKAFVEMANNLKKSNNLAQNLNDLVIAEYSKEKVVKELIEFIGK